jgi:hypothetical protein
MFTGIPFVHQGVQRSRVPAKELAKAVNPLVVFLAARVGQIVAMPAAEIAACPRQVKLADPPIAGSAVDDERTDEPPSRPPTRGLFVVKPMR